MLKLGLHIWKNSAPNLQKIELKKLYDPYNFNFEN